MSKITLENVRVGKDGVALKVSKAGKEYAEFTVMWSSSRKDQAGQREYGPTKYVKVRVFGYSAGDIAANIGPGQFVNVTGNIDHFEWQSNNGPKDDWSLFAESVTLPVPRAQQQGGFQGQQQGNRGGFGGQQAPDNDPWNSAPPAGNGGFGQHPAQVPAGDDFDEPPF